MIWGFGGSPWIWAALPPEHLPPSTSEMAGSFRVPRWFQLFEFQSDFSLLFSLVEMSTKCPGTHSYCYESNRLYTRDDLPLFSFHFWPAFKITKSDQSFGLKDPETNCWRHLITNVAASSLLVSLTKINQLFCLCPRSKIRLTTVFSRYFFSLSHVLWLVRVAIQSR